MSKKAFARQTVARDTFYRRRAAIKIKQKIAACCNFHKKSGHVPDFLYQSGQKFRLPELLSRPDGSGPQARYIASVETVVSTEGVFEKPYLSAASGKAIFLLQTVRESVIIMPADQPPAVDPCGLREGRRGFRTRNDSSRPSCRKTKLGTTKRTDGRPCCSPGASARGARGIRPHTRC